MMKKSSLVAMLVAFVIAPGIARADKDDAKKDADACVKTRVSGQVIMVGPDGKVQVRKLGEGEGGLGIDLQGILQGKPKDGVKKPADKSGVRVFSFGKAFKIGPDGKMEELESLPKNIQDLIKKGGLGDGGVQGSITVIGPDGKKHTQSFGDGKLDADSISKSIGKALEASGKELPEGIQDQLKVALKGLPGAMSLQVGAPQPMMGKDTTGQKLDEILKRLDKLEQQVRDLKKNQP